MSFHIFFDSSSGWHIFKSCKINIISPQNLSLCSLVSLICSFLFFSGSGSALGESVSFSHAQAVLYCLASNFLEVKQLACNLLQKLPPAAVRLQVSVGHKSLSSRTSFEQCIWMLVLLCVGAGEAAVFAAGCSGPQHQTLWQRHCYASSQPDAAPAGSAGCIDQLHPEAAHPCPATSTDPVPGVWGFGSGEEHPGRCTSVTWPSLKMGESIGVWAKLPSERL